MFRRPSSASALAGRGSVSASAAAIADRGIGKTPPRLSVREQPMKLAILPLLLLSVLSLGCAHHRDREVATAIRSASVTVIAGPVRGSGHLTQTEDGTVWCLTAAHVVEGKQKVKV